MLTMIGAQFQRDVVSLSVLVVFVMTVVFLQVCIEVKRCFVKAAVTRASQLAAMATRNLAVAQMKMTLPDVPKQDLSPVLQPNLCYGICKAPTQLARSQRE
jgi:hypothetical protein